MPTPKKGYFNAEGIRVPSVTTVISRFKEAGGLMHWSWQCGMDGKDYRDVRDSAASTGTLAHAMVDAHIHNREAPEITEYTEKQLIQAATAFSAFLDWWRGQDITIVCTEQQMVSERYQCGGTPDGIGWVAGKRSVLDWKSGGVYQDALIQVAAYGAIWNELHPDQLVEAFHIVRFAKDTGDFVHRFYGNLNEALEQFERFRACYDTDKALKKRAA